jgi:hypothetical protein
MYRKNKRANCRAEFKIKPENDDLTYKRKINGKTRYFCQTKSSKMIKAAQIGKRLSILAVMNIRNTAKTRCQKVINRN